MPKFTVGHRTVRSPRRPSAEKQVRALHPDARLERSDRKLATFRKWHIEDPEPKS